MPFTDAEFTQYSLQPGDILLNEGQSSELVGRSAMYNGPANTFAYQNTLVRFRPGPDCDAQFAEELFRSLWVTGVFKRTSKKTTSIAHLGVSRFANLRVRVPPYAEQCRMARVFHHFNAVSNVLKRLARLKRDARDGLTRDLLQGRRRFRDFATYRGQSLVDGLPQDWQRVRIADIARESSLRAGERIYPVLSCTKDRGLVSSLEYFGRQVFSRNLRLYKLAHRDAFVYATNHIEEGSIGLQSSLDAGLVSPMYTVFQLTNDEVLPEFLYAVLKTEKMRRAFQRMTSGSVNRRGAVRWPLFRTVEVLMPTRTEQKQIVSTISALDREIALLERQGDVYKAHKRAVMQRLLSGDIKVMDPTA
jgi:type I restriction enzyme S subunit